MKKETAKKLVKKYPKEIKMYPRESFEEQLEQFLVRYC